MFLNNNNLEIANDYLVIYLYNQFLHLHYLSNHDFQQQDKMEYFLMILQQILFQMSNKQLNVKKKNNNTTTE